MFSSRASRLLRRSRRPKRVEISRSDHGEISFEAVWGNSSRNFRGEGKHRFSTFGGSCYVLYLLDVSIFRTNFGLEFALIMSSSHPESSSGSITFHTAWTHALANPARGLALAREKGWVLAWDNQDWLYLLNQAGERQAQMHAPGKLVAAACADDGSAYVAVGGQGEIWWLAPDLSSRWERSVPNSVTALAVDPFGQYLAVADAGSHLSLFDCQGKPGIRVQTPRPLYHLAFVPTAPFLVAGS